MGVKHSVLQDVQPPNLEFTLFAQLFGPKANKMEAALFIKNGEGRNFDFDFDF